jgi:hypothetical protein
MSRQHSSRQRGQSLPIPNADSLTGISFTRRERLPPDALRPTPPSRASAQHAYEEADEAVPEEALVVPAVRECRSRVFLNDYGCHACS